MTRYVLGFAFDDTGDNVVLIRKTKPAWQAGKYNGVGGKVEPGETSVRAMTREFNEECGVVTDQDEWKPLGIMKGPDWEVVIFYLNHEDVFGLATTCTEEKVCTFSVQSLPETISNVPWLVAAARNHKQNGGEFTLEVKYA